MISEPEIRSENPPIAEKINEENLAETQFPQILVQEEEEEISADEEEATTVAVNILACYDSESILKTVIEKTLVEGIENVTIKADE